MQVFHITDLWGLMAAMLALVLVYLVLERASQTSLLVSSTGGATNDLLRTLQGR